MNTLIAVLIVVLVVVIAMAAGSWKGDGEGYKEVTFSTSKGVRNFDKNSPPNSLSEERLVANNALAQLAQGSGPQEVPSSFGSTPMLNGVQLSGYLPNSLQTYPEHSAPKHYIQNPFKTGVLGQQLMPNYTSANYGFGTPLQDHTYAPGGLFMPPEHLRAPKYNIWRNPHTPFQPQPITMDTIGNSGFYDASF